MLPYVLLDIATAGVLSTLLNQLSEMLSTAPDLFNLYSEYIMRAIEEKEGFTVRRYNWTNIWYADDTTLVADSPEKLQNMLNTDVEESAVKGPNVNPKKTFYMALGKKKEQVNCAFEISGQRIQQLENLSISAARGIQMADALMTSSAGFPCPGRHSSECQKF